MNEIYFVARARAYMITYDIYLQPVVGATFYSCHVETFSCQLWVDLNQWDSSTAQLQPIKGPANIGEFPSAPPMITLVSNPTQLEALPWKKANKMGTKSNGSNQVRKKIGQSNFKSLGIYRFIQYSCSSFQDPDGPLLRKMFLFPRKFTPKCPCNTTLQFHETDGRESRHVLQTTRASST